MRTMYWEVADDDDYDEEDENDETLLKQKKITVLNIKM